MYKAILCTVAVGLAGVSIEACAAPGSGDSNVGIIDTTAPEFLITGVDPETATLGDVITITITATKPLGDVPRVTVNGNQAIFMGEEGGVYTFTYRIQGPEPPGPATVVVQGADSLGNAGKETVTSVLELNMPAFPMNSRLAFAVLLIVAALCVRRLRKAPAALLVLFLLLASTVFAQDPVVSNIQFIQQTTPGDGTEVVVTYDLESPQGPCNIQAFLSKNAGADGFPYPVSSISGDLNEVASGAGRRIVWDVATDYPGEYIAQAQIRVTASLVGGDYSAWEAPYPGWIFSYLSRCQNNMAQMGIAIKSLANESIGRWYPRLSDVSGVLMFREDEVYPEYLEDSEVLRCPGRVEDGLNPMFDDRHYVYLGYALTCDQDVTAFAAAYANEIAAGGDFPANLPGTVSYGNEIYRLRIGIEGALVTDINDPEEVAAVKATTPVMFEWPDNHQQGWGGNVLYLDGHVEFQPYPGEFPMTETAIATLANLAGYAPPADWAKPDPDSPYAAGNDPHGFVQDCRMHFSKLRLILMMYSFVEPAEMFPPLSSEAGRLMMSEGSVYPEYLVDNGILRCPGVPKGDPPPNFEDRDYLYWGYLLLEDADVAAFASAYTAELAQGGHFSDDLPGATSYGDTLYRLRNNVADLLNEPAPYAVTKKTIPLMLEWPDNHEGRIGGHVLYLDGHVEWRDYPGEFPMTPTAMGIFGSLANRVPKTDWSDPNPVYLPENDPFGFTADCLTQVERLSSSPLWMFASESPGGVFPILSEVPGRLMFNETGLDPRYLTDPGMLICPGPQTVLPEPYFDDQHYVYPGYIVTCDDDVTAFVNAYAAEIAGGRDFSGDLPGAVRYGTGDTIYRMRRPQNGSGYFETPSGPPIGAHEIPVLIEWPDHHQGFSGGHVLYLDGHAEWHNYPGEWPMTATTIHALDTVAGWPRTTAWSTRDYTVANDPHKQALCEHNIECLDFALKVFSNRSHGEKYPRLSNMPGNLMFTADEMIPYFVDNPIRLNCPGSGNAFEPPAVDDHNYLYLGYLVLNEADLQSFATAYAAELGGGGDFLGDLPGAVSYGAGNQILRLHQDFAELSMEVSGNPAASYVGTHAIPVLMEWPDNHGSIRGGNVVYMDMHVEWLAYPGRFPMTEAAMTILTSLAGRPPIH